MVIKNYKWDLLITISEFLIPLGFDEKRLYFIFNRIQSRKELINALYQLVELVVKQAKNIKTIEQYELAKEAIHCILQERLKLIEASRNRNKQKASIR